MSFSSGSRESERCRWVRFGGVARLLIDYHVWLFMSVVVTSQCLNVVYIVVSNCLLSRTTSGLNEGITILSVQSVSPFFKLYNLSSVSFR